MKKSLSLLLAVILAFSCVLPVFAEEKNTFTPMQVLAAGDVVYGKIDNGTSVSTPTVSFDQRPATDEKVKFAISEAKEEYVSVKENDTLTVEGILYNEGVLYIPEKSTLNIQGRVVNNGVIINDGKISDIKLITQGEDSAIFTKVVVPEPKAIESYGKVMYSVSVANEGTTIDQIFENGKLDEIYFKDGNEANQTRYIKNDQAMIFRLKFNEAKIDPAKFQVMGNGITLKYDRGVYAVSPVNQAVEVKYGPYVEKNLIKKIKIPLPYGKGYRVVAYGTTLDEATNENIEFAYVDYGSNLSFRVEILEGYENSDVSVFIGGLDPSTQGEDSYISGPDEFGYYTIKNITDTDFAKNNYEIEVVGVVPDETASLIRSIMQSIRRIFETIADIFKTFIDIFKDLGSGSGEHITP